MSKKDNHILFCHFFTLIALLSALAMPGQAFDGVLDATGMSLAGSSQVTPESVDDEQLLQSVLSLSESNIELKRNFFKPLIGEGSAQKVGSGDTLTPLEEKPVMATPQNLGLILNGTLIANERLAYVQAPQEDLVLRPGDMISTMRVLDIEGERVSFALENGDVGILSNEILPGAKDGFFDEKSLDAQTLRDLQEGPIEPDYVDPINFEEDYE